MSDNKLITLWDMAEEIDVNYRTLISCKRELSDFIFGTAESREFWDRFSVDFRLKSPYHLMNIHFHSIHLEVSYAPHSEIYPRIQEYGLPR
ncbi:hypothetical protein AKJ60_00715 [candidate division MSBL1 archaeon SCGC-AAA385M11]|nr:hypothetical protein AKJ60_00715 [candidate division MSBL1 archaeon SCGC-AAA385M11]